MNANLTGKIALVTGGNSGIGRAAADAFAASGATVVVAARRQREGEAVVAEIAAAGGQAEFVQSDVSRAAEVEALTTSIVARYGRLDCAFNNAGVYRGGPVHEFSEEDWDTVCNINLKGVFLCVKYQVAQMLKQGGGAIVNNSSIYGVSAAAYSTAYSASKHGVSGLTRAVALEVATRNIRVNAVCPGFTRTPMTEAALDDEIDGAQIMNISPMKRAGQPGEIAAAVVWLCSDAASFVTGQTLAIDGGVVAGLTPPS